MTVGTATLIVIILFFYFLFMWIFRMVCIVLIIKFISSQVGGAIDKLKKSIGGKADE